MSPQDILFKVRVDYATPLVGNTVSTQDIRIRQPRSSMSNRTDLRWVDLLPIGTILKRVDRETNTERRYIIIGYNPSLPMRVLRNEVLTRSMEGYKYAYRVRHYETQDMEGAVSLPLHPDNDKLGFFSGDSIDMPLKLYSPVYNADGSLRVELDAVGSSN